MCASVSGSSQTASADTARTSPRTRRAGRRCAASPARAARGSTRPCRASERCRAGALGLPARELQPVVEPVEHPGGAEDAQLARAQLDRERKPVERLAELADAGVVVGACRAALAGTARRSANSYSALSSSSGPSGATNSPSAPSGRRLVARIAHLAGTRRSTRSVNTRARVGDVLAVVEQQHGASPRHSAAAIVSSSVWSRWSASPERGRDRVRRRDPATRAPARSTNHAPPAYACAVSASTSSARRVLPTPPGPGQRDQPVLLERLGQRRSARRRGRRTCRAGGECCLRRRRSRRPVVSDWSWRTTAASSCRSSFDGVRPASASSTAVRLVRRAVRSTWRPDR